MKKLVALILVMMTVLTLFFGCKKDTVPDDAEIKYEPKYEETGDTLTDIKLWLDTEGFVACMSQGSFASIIRAYEYNGVAYGETDGSTVYYDGAYGGGCNGYYDGVEYHNDYEWSPETKIATYFNSCSIRVNFDNAAFPCGVRIGGSFDTAMKKFDVDKKIIGEIGFGEEKELFKDESSNLILKKLDEVYWESSDRRYQVMYTEKTQIILSGDIPDDVTRTIVFYFVENEEGNVVLSHMNIKILEEYPRD